MCKITNFVTVGGEKKTTFIWWLKTQMVNNQLLKPSDYAEQLSLMLNNIGCCSSDWNSIGLLLNACLFHRLDSIVTENSSRWRWLKRRGSSFTGIIRLNFRMMLYDLTEKNNNQNRKKNWSVFFQVLGWVKSKHFCTVEVFCQNQKKKKKNRLCLLILTVNLGQF